MPRRIAFLVFPQFQILDATGPIAAFEIAERFRPGSYTLRTIATTAGAVASSSGVCLHVAPLCPAHTIDTLIIAGGEGTRAAATCGKTLKFVLSCAQRSRRVASVCSGTFVLAAAGLLDGRSATTHWSVTAEFNRRFPGIRLDADRIYVRDGKIWSSRGARRSSSWSTTAGPEVSRSSRRCCRWSVPTAASASYGIMSGRISATGSASRSSRG
jgi:transcriptional regulator GlxA family with amidase domain